MKSACKEWRICKEVLLTIVSRSRSNTLSFYKVDTCVFQHISQFVFYTKINTTVLEDKCIKLLTLHHHHNSFELHKNNEYIRHSITDTDKGGLKAVSEVFHGDVNLQEVLVFNSRFRNILSKRCHFYNCVKGEE